MVAAQTKLREAFAGVGFSSHGEFYVPASAAAEYLDACSRAGLAIAGIEGFERHGDRLKPRLDLIADFSALLGGDEWSTTVRSSVDEAVRFVSNVVGLGSGLWLSVVAVAQDEGR